MLRGCEIPSQPTSASQEFRNNTASFLDASTHNSLLHQGFVLFSLTVTEMCECESRID